MGKPTGFLEYERKNEISVEPEIRIKDFKEFHKGNSAEEAKKQAARCMACGVPFCQSGSMISGMASGCPLHNLVPETNELVYLDNFEQAYVRLAKTHSFPEFTSRVCPALCEAACTCSIYDGAVSTRANERSIIDYAFAHDLVREEAPQVRTGKRVAIIGSGPAGLAAAQLLNRRGHSVTVFEKNDRPGGLLRYGIPNMKLDKRSIDRRIELMEKAGIEFKCGINVGVDISGDEIKNSYDRVILCGGAEKPRDIAAPGRDAKGIYFAVPFLSEVSKRLMDCDYESAKAINYKGYSFGSLKGKNVVVIGGGDTGNDCVATCVRLEAGSVTQLEMMPAAPESRADSNPWPEWPKVLKTDYGQEEAAYVYGHDPRIFKTTVTEFLKDEKGCLTAVKTVQVEMVRDKSGKTTMKQIAGTEKELPADLVLIAAGFLGAGDIVIESFKVEKNARGNVATLEGEYKTSEDTVFTAGDMHRGQSLVVWAIAEGRAVAKEVDESLMGYTNL